MRSLVVTGPAEHSIERVPVPEAGPEEALVAVSHVALCGSDLMLLAGTLHDAEYPVVPGHEWSGTVRSAPSRPELVGARVVGTNFTACERCEWCLAGRHNLCPELDEVGFTRPGACADYVVVPAANLRVLPAGIGLREACLLEPLGVALHAVERAGDLTGRSVLVLGGGTIGLLVAQLVRAAGARSTVVVEPVAERRAIADRSGLPAVAAADVVEPPEVLFDATGSAAAFRIGLAAIRPAGVYVLVGYSGLAQISLAPAEFMLKELTLIGSLSGYGTIDAAIEAVRSGAVDLTPLVVPAGGLDAYADATGLATSSGLRLVLDVAG